MKKKPHHNADCRSPQGHMEKLLAMETWLQKLNEQLDPVVDSGPKPVRPLDKVTGKILDRLIDLEAQSGEIATLAKEAKDLKTALKAVSASTKIIAIMIQAVKEFPSSAAAWQQVNQETNRCKAPEAPRPDGQAPQVNQSVNHSSGLKPREMPQGLKDQVVGAKAQEALRGNAAGGQSQQAPAVKIADIADQISPPWSDQRGYALLPPVHEDPRYIRRA